MEASVLPILARRMIIKNSMSVSIICKHCCYVKVDILHKNIPKNQILFKLDIVWNNIIAEKRPYVS